MKGLFHILSPINLDHSSQLRQQSGKTTWTADTLLWLFLPTQPLPPPPPPNWSLLLPEKTRNSISEIQSSLNLQSKPTEKINHISWAYFIICLRICIMLSPPVFSVVIDYWIKPLSTNPVLVKVRLVWYGLFCLGFGVFFFSIHLCLENKIILCSCCCADIVDRWIH